MAQIQRERAWNGKTRATATRRDDRDFRSGTYLNCDDGADAIEASAERPGSENEVELCTREGKFGLLY